MRRHAQERRLKFQRQGVAQLFFSKLHSNMQRSEKSKGDSATIFTAEFHVNIVQPLAKELET